MEVHLGMTSGFCVRQVLSYYLPLHMQRLACQVSAYMYRHSHGWQEVPSDQAVHVSMRGLLPEAQQLHAAANDAPVFWQPSKQRLNGNFDCFDSLFAAGGHAAEEECGDSMLCGILALKHAAGGHKQAKVLADGIRDAATMRLAGQLDGLDPAVKQALNDLGMSVALGCKDGGAASTEFSAIQLQSMQHQGWPCQGTSATRNFARQAWAMQQGRVGQVGRVHPLPRQAGRRAPRLRRSGVAGAAVPVAPMAGHICSLCMVEGWQAVMGNAAGQGREGGLQAEHLN